MDASAEKTGGPAVRINDFGNKPIKGLWTDSLIGCIALAIIGFNEDGTKDLFYCHAKHWDLKHATRDHTNPMYEAKAFAAAHKKIRVMWGTGYSAYTDLKALKHQARIKLTKDLGIWVREDDFVLGNTLCFLPQDMMLRSGDYKSVKQEVEENPEEIKLLRDYSQAKIIQRPKKSLAYYQLCKKIATLEQASKGFRFIFYDGRRKAKIRTLEIAKKAFLCGDLDRFEQLMFCAQQRILPWDGHVDNFGLWATSGESNTYQLIEAAKVDLVTQLRAMNAHHAAVSITGQPLSELYYLKEEYHREAARPQALTKTG